MSSNLPKLSTTSPKWIRAAIFFVASLGFHQILSTQSTPVFVAVISCVLTYLSAYAGIKILIND